MPGDRLILSVVSGKGGVGKTMLSVAIANELAKEKRTLLIDLDFFNRGLTGLMDTLKIKAPLANPIRKPTFLQRSESPPSPVETSQEDSWNVVKVKKGLWYVDYPDLGTDDIRKFEYCEIHELTKSISEFVERAAAIAGCDCVVLDCHGGPDNSSFAACLLADHTILVSEPDRITLFGTLNFVRQFWSVTGKKDADIHLLFNKIVPAFTSRFLERFYRRQLMQDFGGRRLLAMYPIEPHLTKEFEITPFLTDVFPTSMLARKTRVLLYDLLAEKEKWQLTRSMDGIGALRRYFIRQSLGKPSLILHIPFIGAIIVGVIITFGALIFLEDVVIGKWLGADMNRVVSLLADGVRMINDHLKTAGRYVIAVLSLWFSAALFLDWHKKLQTYLTYHLRQGHVVRVISLCLTAMSMYFFPALFWGAGIGIFWKRDGDQSFSVGLVLGWGGLILGSLIGCRIVVDLCVLAYDEARFDGRYVDAAAWGVIIASILASGCLGFAASKP